MIDIISLEKELKKRWKFPYKWGMRQNNFYNGITNFIYKTFSFDDLLKEINYRFKNDKNYNAFFNYALNRWYNFWSAKGVEDIFCSINGVTPAKDEKDRLVDFEIHNIKFDHKTSVYPKGYEIPYEKARKNPGDLIEWLYENQSQQQRHHLKNRLFIVLYNNNGEHWQLKADLTTMKGLIEGYVNNFDKNKLLKFTFIENEITLSDIIWFVK